MGRATRRHPRDKIQIEPKNHKHKMEPRWCSAVSCNELNCISGIACAIDSMIRITQHFLLLERTMVNMLLHECCGSQNKTQFQDGQQSGKRNFRKAAIVMHNVWPRPLFFFWSQDQRPRPSQISQQAQRKLRLGIFKSGI